MRRVIEDLVEKRKRCQAKVKDTLSQLGTLMENASVFLGKKKKGKINEKLLEFNEDLIQLMTIQDKEWDAYSNNHSTSVFKSLQWKIEKLEAEYSNVKTLLINYGHLEKRLEHLMGKIDSTGPGNSVQPEVVEQLRECKAQ
ncbi:MAG: hypothetical protein GY765_30805, partial [bacterium]|nr:hypothetical protein [bacterium]